MQAALQNFWLKQTLNFQRDTLNGAYFLGLTTGPISLSSAVALGDMIPPTYTGYFPKPLFSTFGPVQKSIDGQWISKTPTFIFSRELVGTTAITGWYVFKLFDLAMVGVFTTPFSLTLATPLSMTLQLVEQSLQLPCPTSFS